MFERLINDINKKAKEKQDTVILDLPNNTIFNNNLLFLNIENGNIDRMEDSKLYDMIRMSYHELLERIFNTKDIVYIKAFTNPKLLQVLIQVMSDVVVSYSDKIYCNKLAYDYITLDNHDNYIKSLLLSLARVVNKDLLPGLLGIGLDQDLATCLTIARFSSFDIRINVKRVNFIIMTQSGMTEQKVVYIFEKLYDSFTSVFETSMFETLDEEQEWITDEIKENFSTISLVLLDILSNMETKNILYVLETYAKDWELVHDCKPVRFNINNISDDYIRIKNVFPILKQRGIKLPE